MQAKALGVALFLYLAHEAIKEVAAAAVGAEDFDTAAPGNAGVGYGVELARVRMQRKLIQHAVAAFAGLGIGVRAHAVEPEAVGHRQHIGRVALFIHRLLAQVFGAHLQDVGKVLAILQKEPCLNLIAARDPGIQPRVF